MNKCYGISLASMMINAVISQLFLSVFCCCNMPVLEVNVMLPLCSRSALLSFYSVQVFIQMIFILDEESFNGSGHEVDGTLYIENPFLFCNFKCYLP